MPRRGQIKKRNNGKYLARVYLGRDQDGTRHWTSKTFDKKKEADSWLSERLANQARGAFLAPTRENTGQYLRRWLTDVSSNHVSERTYDDYTYAVEKYLIPALGRTPLSDLRPDTIQMIYNHIAENSGPHMVRKCHAVLHSALAQAMKWRLIAINVASLAEPPSIPEPVARPLSAEEVPMFLDAIVANRYEAYFVTLLDTGMRPGEALALTWDDIDFVRARIHISKALSTGRGKLYYSQGKTPKSRRSVTITTTTLLQLQLQKENIVKKRSTARRWEDKNLVFPNSIGGYSDESNISNRYFKPVIQQIGLPITVRVYDLRHTTATLLLESDVNSKVVAERLGHADVSMTLRRYSHVTPTMQDKAALTMSTYLTHDHNEGV